MNQIIVGTSNPAKIQQVQGALANSHISVVGIDKDQSLDINEDGNDVSENARHKAITYAKHLGKSVLSMDNGLFFDGLEAQLQPGTHVRRIPGFSFRPSDQQMLNYYVQLTSKLGEKVKAHWEFAVCIANPKGEYLETVITSPRIFVDKPSPKMVVGYPLESVQIDPMTGKYIAEMSKEEQELFWQQEIGQPLTKFIVLALGDARFS